MIEVICHIKEAFCPIFITEHQVDLGVFLCEWHESDPGHHRLVVMGPLVLGPVALPILWLDEWSCEILASDQLVAIDEASEWVAKLVLNVGATSFSEKLHLGHVPLLE